MEVSDPQSDIEHVVVTKFLSSLTSPPSTLNHPLTLILNRDLQEECMVIFTALQDLLKNRHMIVHYEDYSQQWENQIRQVNSTINNMKDMVVAS